MAFSSIIKSLDYFFVLRPVLFIPGWSTLLAGYFIASKKEIYFTPDVFLYLDLLQPALLLLIFSAAMGASFLLNQLMDIETDLKNKKLFILSENHISKRAAVIETGILIILALAVSLYLKTAILTVMVLFILITGYMYNFKPFVLKDRPLGSIAANALMGWLAFAAGWLALNPFSYQIFVDSLPYLFFNTGLYFFTLLPDIPGDQKSKKETVAVLYGVNKVIIIAFAFYAVSLLCSLILKDYFSIIFTGGTLPFFLLVITRRTVDITVKTTKYAILFFAFALWLKIPFYFLLLLAIFIFTKWYFKKRFNYDYPNFKGA